MHAMIEVLVWVLIILATGYAINLFGLKSTIDKRLGLNSATYKLHVAIKDDRFLFINNKRKNEVFNFSLSSLENITLIKRDGYTVDTIYYFFKVEGLDIFTVSEDEMDSMEFYEKLKIFLNRTTIFIEAMKILEEDRVVLWEKDKPTNAAAE